MKEKKETKKEAKVREREEAKGQLRACLKPGDRVYTILPYVSKSGMMRHISTFTRGGGGSFHDITYLVGRILDRSVADDGGLKCSGCGMDMGFEVVYALGYNLWPEGFGLPMTPPENSPYGPTEMRPVSKDAAAELRAQGYTARSRNGDGEGWDNDGGYALEQSWL